MPPLRVKFVDFWPGFDTQSNEFLRILSMRFSVSVSDDPELVLFSCFGSDHKKYRDALKVFFTGENVRPNPYLCDASISFDPNDGQHNFRWPLYRLYAPPAAGVSTGEKFCSFLVSNPSNTLRTDFFTALNAQRRVDSGGKVLNNMGGAVAHKMDFLRQYRFSIAFENAAYPGYTTEKLWEAKLAGCVPIYWGNPDIAQDFNPKSFIQLGSYRSIEACVSDVLAIDADHARFRAIADEPLFGRGHATAQESADALADFLYRLVADRPRRTRSPLMARAHARISKWRTEQYHRRACAAW